MAQQPTKRSRPAFSPPRPKSSKAAGKVSKSKPTEKARGRPSLSKQRKKQSRVASQSPSASDSAQSSPSSLDSPQPSASPEPEFMLAEVTHEPSHSFSEPTIPLPLLHRIAQHHFQDKDKTRISADARELLGVYVDTFVREAIVRATYVKGERDGNGDDGGMGSGRDTGDGWLEVEDLEKLLFNDELWECGCSARTFEVRKKVKYKRVSATTTPESRTSCATKISSLETKLGLSGEYSGGYIKLK